MNTCIKNSVSLYNEMLSYEILWGLENASLKSLGTQFKQLSLLPSELLDRIEKESLFGLSEIRKEVIEYLSNLEGFSICLKGLYFYPEGFSSVDYPFQLFYYKGDIGLLDSPCISVVGARECSAYGREFAKDLATGLSCNGFTVVSGLAKGIDTAALGSTVSKGGNVIGVIGTPINEYYPKENSGLQDLIAKEHLLISHVPFYRYHKEKFPSQRRYFPQRNIAMAAITSATVIVEASDKSGTHIQARECLKHGKKLIIAKRCLENDSISWPKNYVARGAFVIENVLDLIELLHE